ncbi:hypothetical protein BA763_13715 [Burkholderia cenocepacia]|nr:hypothetical protein BA763_13715 [Burkholderia cenocepacia]
MKWRLSRFAEGATAADVHGETLVDQFQHGQETEYREFLHLATRLQKDIEQWKQQPARTSAHRRRLEACGSTLAG